MLKCTLGWLSGAGKMNPPEVGLVILRSNTPNASLAGQSSNKLPSSPPPHYIYIKHPGDAIFCHYLHLITWPSSLSLAEMVTRCSATIAHQPEGCKTGALSPQFTPRAQRYVLNSFFSLISSLVYLFFFSFLKRKLLIKMTTFNES